MATAGGRPLLAGGGADPYARKSPLTGERVPQRVYRQHLAEAQATRAGLTLTGQRSPRAEVTRATKAGFVFPAVPKPKRAGGRWYDLGQSGGRIKRTAGRKTLEKDLRQAAKQGRKVILHVKADGIVAPGSKPKRLDEATLGGAGRGHAGIDPELLIDYIDAEGSVDGGIRAALEATVDYSSVGEIDSYTLKMY